MAEAESADDVDPMEDAAAWQELSREEQSDILDEGVADLRGEAGEGDWRHLSEEEQQETIRTIEDGGPDREALSETERAMQDALQDTYEVQLFEGLDDVTTVPFECRPLSGVERDKLDEAIQFVMQAEEQVEDAGEIDDLETEGTHFDSPEEIDEWLPQFLEDVTVDEAFDAERWRTGKRLRAGTRQQLLLELYLHHHEENERAAKFRAGDGG